MCSYTPKKNLAKSKCLASTTIQSIRADLGMAIMKSSTEILIMHGSGSTMYNSREIHEKTREN